MSTARRRRNQTLLLALGLGAPLAAALWMGGTESPSEPASASPAADRAERVTATTETRRTVSWRAAAATEAQVHAISAAYRADAVMVAPAAGHTLAGIAHDLDLEVVRAAGPSGYGALAVPADVPVGALLYELRSSGLIRAAAPLGVTQGAGDPPMTSAQAADLLAAAQAAEAALVATVATLQAERDALAAALLTASDALTQAEADLDAGKDADVSDAEEDALKAIVEQRDDAEAAAADALDDADRALSDAISALEDAQDATADATQQLADTIAFEEFTAAAAERARVRKVHDVQWFLKRTGHPKWRLDKNEDRDAYVAPDFSEWVVAVLDTGVAYEDRSEGGVSYRAVESLTGSAIVAPWDFVNDDAHANDDHQHGTHIASIIASDADVQGVAPGVQLMPLKVLNQDNQGTELDLVDAIWHAIDNGAHVINMSLSFHPSYVPSQALQEALKAARDAGVVLVAASGNNGVGVVTWPAASPQVLAVGSATMKDNSKLRAADYSNLSNGVAFVAPGGAVDLDDNEDGFSDGILGETIALNQPDTTGWWFYAGTSQAAALASAAAVHLLDAGASATEAINALQYGADDGDIEGEAFVSGIGAGLLDIEASLDALENDREDLAYDGGFHVAMMPYLRWDREVEYDNKGNWKCKETDKYKVKDGDRVVPTARFMVYDDDGVPAPDVYVKGLMWGTKEATFSCKTNSEGYCEVKGQKMDPNDYKTPELEMEIAQAWQVEALVRFNIGHIPSQMIFATDAFDILVGAARATPELDGGLLGFFADQSCAMEPIGEVAEGYSVVNAGTGLATSPMGMVFTTPMVTQNATITDIPVDLDGTGLATSPMGFTTFKRIDFDLDGTGLATSPMGLTMLRLAAFEGTGLATSPMGFHMRQVFEHMSGTGLATSPMGFNSEPVLLQQGIAMGVDLTGSSLGDQLAEQGWVTEDGQTAAAVLVGTGLVGIGAPTGETHGSGTSEGSGAVEIDPGDVQP